MLVQKLIPCLWGTNSPWLTQVISWQQQPRGRWKKKMEMLERNVSVLVVIILLASCAGKSKGCTQLIRGMLWGSHLDSVPLEAEMRDVYASIFNPFHQLGVPLIHLLLVRPEGNEQCCFPAEKKCCSDIPKLGSLAALMLHLKRNRRNWGNYAVVM